MHVRTKRCPGKGTRPRTAFPIARPSLPIHPYLSLPRDLLPKDSRQCQRLFSSLPNTSSPSLPSAAQRSPCSLDSGARWRGSGIAHKLIVANQNHSRRLMGWLPFFSLARLMTGWPPFFFTDRIYHGMAAFFSSSWIHRETAALLLPVQIHDMAAKSTTRWRWQRQ